jgi:hypothetical protein
MNKCLICLDDDHALFNLCPDCTFCTECLTHYAALKIESGLIDTLPCPNCAKGYPLPELEPYCNKDTLDEA